MLNILSMNIIYFKTKLKQSINLGTEYLILKNHLVYNIAYHGSECGWYVIFLTS